MPWSFLRWLSDHFDPDGTLGLQRTIVSGTTSGFANIEAAIGGAESMSTLLAQWAAMLYVDDRVVGAETRLTMPSWDLLHVIETGLLSGLHLVPTEVSFAAFTETLKVRAASTGYFPDQRDHTAGYRGPRAGLGRPCPALDNAILGGEAPMTNSSSLRTTLVLGALVAAACGDGDAADETPSGDQPRSRHRGGGGSGVRRRRHGLGGPRALDRPSHSSPAPHRWSS